MLCDPGILARIGGTGLFLLLAALSSPGADLKSTESTDAYLKGRYIYERNCAVCHGKWGDGNGEMAKGMVPRPRTFTAGIFKYKSTPSSFLPMDEDLMRTISGGVPGTSMPA